MTPDELLTTTRAVRRRLDLDRPVPRALIRECLEIALQAPSGGNTQGWHFVVVDDPGQRARLAGLYRQGWARYKRAPGSLFALQERETDARRRAQLARIGASADYLAEQLHRVPVLVIPCIAGRPETLAAGPAAAAGLATLYGSVLPAAWSFMLAARARGLGTAWTTVHLIHEREAAEVLGIPYDEITQAALIPTAFALGEGFGPAARRPLDPVLHFDRWQASAAQQRDDPADPDQRAE